MLQTLDMKWPGAAETARTVRQQEVSPVSISDSKPNSTIEQSRSAYQIVVIGDAVMVISPNGSVVQEGDMWQVSDLLREAKHQSRQSSEDYEAMNLDWAFPKKRSECFGISRCVYAIMPTVREHTVRLPAELQSEWPNVMKIGFTKTSLTSRRTGLDGDLGGDLVVYAYAECDRPAYAEAGIHRLLSPGRVFGEWFHRDYVMGFLCGGRP
jgi:hypothetical protein